MWTLADRIWKARKHAGMEQIDLGNAIGVSKSQVSKWERELSEPKVSMVRRIASVTGVAEQWLLTGSGTVSGFCGQPRLRLLPGGNKRATATPPLNLFMSPISAD